MEYIAHIRQSDQEIQTVKEHLLEVKNLAEQHGDKVGMKHLAGLAGMLHDLGKCGNEFKEYILEAVRNPDNPPKRGSVDHSTAGGKLLYNFFHTGKINPNRAIVAEVVGNAIISHHSYLQDFITPELNSKYLIRVSEKELIDFDTTVSYFFENVIEKDLFYKYVDKACEEIVSLLGHINREDISKQLMFITKFVFSALIDADRTNTRQFEEDSIEERVNYEELFQVYYSRLTAKIKSFENHPSAEHPINKLRSQMSNQCDNFAENPSGVYTLSIPTGGGKTLASLRYALRHSLLHNKKRIIYVVPYTTIIEQNAEEVRKILQDDENILEHHSNVIEDTHDDDENEDGIMSTQQKLKLAKDNWHSPIIFTTMVQFLDTFYGKGTRSIRRMHNLSDAVIVFDEVQKVPIKCVSLFNQAINFLKDNCHSSILLCTATQPALDFVEHKLEMDPDGEIINHLERVMKAFKRVEIVDKASNQPMDTSTLAEFVNDKIEELNSILVILNTKKTVRALYQYLTEMRNNIPIYHLSTTMCAAHRNAILSEVREHLKQGNKIICISTQLIEAGVDVSFDCVIRSLAGLDSIAQAAGRCNRHGEKDIQQVYVIDHKQENLTRLREIAIGKQISKRILVDLSKDETSHGGSVLSNQAMERYFKEFYTDFTQDLNYFIPELKKEMTELLMAPKHKSSFVKDYYSKYKKWPPIFITNSYYTAAEHFQVIEDRTTSVLVPYGEGKEIIAELNGNYRTEELSTFLKKAQHYTVNLYPFEKDYLNRSNGLVSYFDGKILALKESAYDKTFGLDVENESSSGIELF
ncbi:CRISPR-associated helicase/endonuclease Cas3 [Pontibacillus litoralis]|uniref:CRISPR-associated protein Cas3 n=1 Tax=Pontibacillus litoralis JSM 072002 TaxID=1385512 RepID=A0A0A5GAR2_9BACI|nr:CRISPR-associated helicase/endonuclease Cas3 [Pontibacillus litoralis]KGX88205.1 CRISPR-associated protein Cas3 [Pontibacillus litoralis JSM 072002]